MSSNDIIKAVNFLKNDEVVAIPTETVYGLAANALCEKAVKKIFIAKGRPSDNPLIVHISNLNMTKFLVKNFDRIPFAKELAENFWPGPLTMILPKTDLIPKVTSGGLDTVAIRFPSHPIIQKIISEAGFPLAAPSANLSGSPSPTNFEHVFNDMNGKIAAIIKYENCKFGVESTIINLCSDIPKIMRPGNVTIEKISKIIPNVEIDKAVCEKFISENSIPEVICPGVKYRHYAPKTRLTIINSNQSEFLNFVKNNQKNNIVALCFEEDKKFMDEFKIPYIIYGSEKNSESQAKNLFTSLRECDNFGANIIYARCPKKDGVGLAVFNRLLRAAEFNILNLP